jgi:hypothetical protein
MSEATSKEAQKQIQYVSAETFKKLNAYVNELVAEHNKLEARVIQLEHYKEARQPVEIE